MKFVLFKNLKILTKFWNFFHAQLSSAQLSWKWKVLILWYFYFYDQVKFHAQLSWAWKTFYNLGAWCGRFHLRFWTQSLVHVGMAVNFQKQKPTVTFLKYGQNAPQKKKKKKKKNAKHLRTKDNSGPYPSICMKLTHTCSESYQFKFAFGCEQLNWYTSFSYCIQEG